MERLSPKERTPELLPEVLFLLPLAKNNLTNSNRKTKITSVIQVVEGITFYT
jgi:hypothetical protein